ncbi:GGDEF domain-containing response regulator [Paraliobacillus ryukyuensis]|uniref:GGDEF domain-containing response regulator n=1 Tax=Paraliobacillus ryukyuensis TaxID=200904 RepID=UPI0009A8D65B|nr:diguanylate cyclase [Paraliobacillus ryukyuensis]
MNNYEQIFVNRLIQDISKWREQQVITTEQLKSGITNMKKNASYIELTQIAETAAMLLNKLDVMDKKEWGEEEWSNFIQPLTFLFYDQTQNITDRKRVLLIDSAEQSMHQMKEALEDNCFEVLLATNTKRAIKSYYDFHPDILFIDACSNEQMAFTILSRIKDRATEAGVIIFIIGNKEDTNLKINAYTHHVTDVIDKPINYELLEALMQNRIHQQDLFRNIVLIDELTKAGNRTLLNTIWKELSNKFHKWQHTFSFALLDLDFFKSINDQYGHAIGDEVLKHFSSIILQYKRTQDYLIRYGGEEFLLVLTDYDQADTKTYVQGLLQTLIETPFILNGKNIDLTFTAGVAEMNETIESLETLVVQADKALYYGKKTGRKQVVEYNELTMEEQGRLSKEKLKIAIVDDDRFIKRLLEDKMAELEIGSFTIEVEGFLDGETFMASDWYKGRDKKILLLDGVLPKLDGLDILQELREKVNEEELGIIMLTGRQKNSDMIRALELGADDYITKPFSLEQLDARIKRLVQRLFIR